MLKTIKVKKKIIYMRRKHLIYILFFILSLSPFVYILYEAQSVWYFFRLLSSCSSFSFNMHMEHLIFKCVWVCCMCKQKQKQNEWRRIRMKKQKLPSTKDNYGNSNRLPFGARLLIVRTLTCGTHKTNFCFQISINKTNRTFSKKGVRPSNK